MIVKNVEKKEKSVVTFVVEADAAEFESAVNRAYLKNKKSIYVPGFRKGKAPRMVVEGMYGADVFHEDAINDVAPSAFEMGVEQEKLNTVGAPSIKDAKVGEDKSLTLTFETAVYPEVTLGAYKGIEAVRPVVEVTDKDVEDELARIQKRNSRLVTVERAAKEGDTAVIDFEGFLDGVAFEGGKGEGHSLELGSGSFVPGFEEQVVGMTAGEEKDIDITFPEDYAAELAGKAVVFHVKCNEVKENEVPELDDEFAKDVSEFDTLEEYKGSIREDIAKRKNATADSDFHNGLLAQAVANMTVEIPDAMVEEKLDNMMNEYSQNLAMQGYSLEQYLQMLGMDVATFRNVGKSNALRQAQSELLLTAVAEAENIELTAEEIEEEFKKVAEEYSVDLETVKKAVSEDAIKSDMRMRKAAEVIYAAGVPTEPKAEEPEAAENADAAEESKDAE